MTSGGKPNPIPPEHAQAGTDLDDSDISNSDISNPDIEVLDLGDADVDADKLTRGDSLSLAEPD